MKPGFLLPVAALLAAGLGLIAYLHAGVSIPVLEPAGPVALEERRVILITFALASIIVIPVFFLLFFFAWKYHDTNPDANVTHEPDWDHDSLLAEFSWWLVPGVIIAILGVLAWESSNQLDPYKPLPGGAPLEVQVVALDWKWLFIYPKEGIASVNALEVPVGVPVHFVLTADAPMNSFWIPQLGGQIMVMPGMTTQLNLEASVPGNFAGYSANISGEGFSGMHFDTHAVPQSDFDAWVAGVQAASTTSLSLSAYRALAQPSDTITPYTYSSVEPTLYTDIVGSYGPMGSMNMQ